MYTVCCQSLHKWLVKKLSFTRARNTSKRRKLIEQLSKEIEKDTGMENCRKDRERDFMLFGKKSRLLFFC